MILNAQSPTFEWAKSMGGTTDDIGVSIITDASGNVYTIGSFNGTADFDPGAGVYNLTAIGSHDFFIQKLDAAGNFVWAKRTGGSSDTDVNSIAIDAFGDLYITGSFAGTIDFDPGTGVSNLTASFLTTQAFIQKLDANGNFIWAKATSGLSAACVGRSVDTDALGNVYITGYFIATIDFDPGTGVSNFTSNGNHEIFILKLDASGNFVWAKSMGDTSLDWGYSISIDPLGNVFTTGYFFNTVDFDPGTGVNNLSSNGGQDIFIQKLDANGNFIWAKNIGGSSYDGGISITTDGTGHIYTTGYFKNTADFDPSIGITNLTSNGSNDIFVQKLDASGNLVWAKSIGGSSNDVGTSIGVDTSGNVYTTGFFDGTIDFDPGVGIHNLTSNARDIFIQKLDANGNFIWAKNMGGTNSDRANSITLDASGNVYTTGEFRNTVDFDPGTGVNNLVSNGSFRDIFILKLSDSSQPLPTTAINDPNCGTTITMATDIYATSVAGALSYRFRLISNAATPDTIISIRPNFWFRPNLVLGILYGTTYSVTASVAITPGVYGPYDSTPCLITTPSAALLSTALLPADCAVGTLDSMSQILFANAITSAVNYEFKWHEVSSGLDFVRSRTTPSIRGELVSGISYGKTYQVSVRWQQSDGTWSAYGPTCTITTPSAVLLLSELLPADCAVGTLDSMNQILFANAITGAVNYEFKWHEISSGLDFVRSRTTPSIWGALVPGINYGETYQVSIRWQQSDGTWSAYGSVCTITTPSAVLLLSELLPTDCAIGTLDSMNQTLFANSISGAVAYEFKWTEISTSLDYQRIRTTPNIKPTLISGISYGETYLVSVRWQQADGTWSAYGSTCSITTPTAAALLTNVVPSDCNATLTMSDQIDVTPISGAIYYDYRFDDNAGNVYNRIINAPSVRGNQVVGLVDGTYDVDVRWQQGNGTWSVYGTSCSITIAPVPGSPAFVLNDKPNMENIAVDHKSKLFTEPNLDISVYPNPTKDFAIISANQTIKQIEVYTIEGKLIYVNQPNTTQINIDLTSLDQGLFIVKVYSDNRIETKKLIKQ